MVSETSRKAHNSSGGAPKICDTLRTAISCDYCALSRSSAQPRAGTGFDQLHRFVTATVAMRTSSTVASNGCI